MIETMSILRGDREEFDFVLTNTLGNPINLTNTLVIFGIKTAAPLGPLEDLDDISDPFKFHIEINSGGSVVSSKGFTLVGLPTLGTIRLTLLPTETTLYTATQYPTEIQIRYGGPGSSSIKSRPGPKFLIERDLVRRVVAP